MNNSDHAARSSVLQFRTGAAMISRLGSEQLKDHFTAVIELVKNSYDADANIVTIEVRDIEGGQRLRIQDDGSGMTVEDLESKWAYLATVNKVREDRSPKYRRLRLGQKGVGRFATEKLGRKLVLRTRVEGSPAVHQVRFDWSTLDADRELREYEFPVTRAKPETFEPSHGTRLDIRELRRPWQRKDVARLRNQLSSLIDPDVTTTDFRIRLDTPWEELNGHLANPLPGNETHRLDFELDAEGNEAASIWERGTMRREKRTHPKPPFGPVRGVLRYFGEGIRKVDASRGGDPDADWNVGVRVFRDGCRVRPYGEPGPEGDWLQFYRVRYQRGSRFRLKPHYLQGAVHISKDANPNLRDTTSREGLEENDASEALVAYVQEKIALLSDLVREEELKEERQKTRARYEKALAPLTRGLSQCKSEVYREAIQSSDETVRKTLIEPSGLGVTRNAHWECADCNDSWKVPRELIPSRCREHSVGRDGRPTHRPGCGSTNVRRKANVPREETKPTQDLSFLDDIVGGDPAYVSGIQLRPTIDWGMGERDEEGEVRPEQRILAINARHPAFRTADSLDGTETVEGTDIESLRAVAGLTIHIIDTACQAWGRWHYERTKEFGVFASQYSELKAACLAAIEQRGKGAGEIAGQPD